MGIQIVTLSGVAARVFAPAPAGAATQSKDSSSSEHASSNQERSFGFVTRRANTAREERCV